MRQRRARGGRADPALGGLLVGDLQVRPRQRVHRGAPARCTGWTRPSRCGYGTSRSLPATWRRPGSTRPRHPRGPHDRPHLRGYLGAGHGPATVSPCSTYLYHVVDNEYTMREYASQAVVWQTAINPVVALELLDRSGEWTGTGVLGPEAFPAAPFLSLLAEYGLPPRDARARPGASCRGSRRGPLPARHGPPGARVLGAPGTGRSAAAARAGRAARFRSCARSTRGSTGAR